MGNDFKNSHIKSSRDSSASDFYFFPNQKSEITSNMASSDEIYDGAIGIDLGMFLISALKSAHANKFMVQN